MSPLPHRVIGSRLLIPGVGAQYGARGVLINRTTIDACRRTG